MSVFLPAAQIQIIIQTPIVSAGGVIMGVVIFKVVKDSVDGNSLVLTFSGKEDCVAVYHSRDSSTVTRQSHTIVSTSNVLASSSNGTFARGEYRFPFGFQLQPYLPPTMSVKKVASFASDSGSKCSITYSLYAKLERATGLFKYNIDQTASFTVFPHLNPIAPERSPVIVGPFSRNAVLNFCCCSFERGTFDLGIASTSDWCVPNENIEVSYVIQNNSYAWVYTVSIGFYQRVTWVVNAESLNEVKSIYLPIRGVNGSNFPPLRGGQLVNARLSDNELRQMLINGIYRCPFKIPDFGCASYDGKLIKVTHALVLRIDTPFGTSNPWIECPITITRPGPAVRVQSNNPIPGHVIQVQPRTVGIHHH